MAWPLVCLPCGLLSGFKITTGDAAQSLLVLLLLGFMLVTRKEQ